MMNINVGAGEIPTISRSTPLNVSVGGQPSTAKISGRILHQR
jgi:hypothetical protein